MGQRDMHNHIEQKNALDPQDITSDTTTVGDIIDTQGNESLEFLIQSATITDGTFLPLIEDGDDSGLSDAAPVADQFLLGTEVGAQFVAADDNQVSRIGYIGNKRFVRLSLVSSGTTLGGNLGAVAILDHPRRTEDLASQGPNA